MDAKTDSAPAASPDASESATPAPAKAGWLTWLQASAHVAEIVGVILVVASLFFLSAQIQQNTTQLRRADLNATHDHWSAIRLFMAGDREHAAFWSASLNGAELDPPDQIRFNALMAEYARATFQIWDRNKSSNFDKDDFVRSAAPPLARVLCTVGGLHWWSQFRTEFPAGFAEEMDEVVAAMVLGPGSGDPQHPCGGPSPQPVTANG